MSGNHGGDLFEFPDRSSEEILKKQALIDVLSSDILEWYRIQYNYSIHDPRFTEVSEEEAMRDFYRRQYYHEIQYGLRDFSSKDIKFNMPSFILLKQFGGALPAPNGFKYTDSNTISNEELKNKKSNDEFEERNQQKTFLFQKKASIRIFLLISQHQYADHMVEW